MLRYALALGLGLGIVALSAAVADDKKDETKTVEGKLVCTKCTLSETKACGHAVQVKEGDKTVTYFLDAKAGKELHKEVCPAGSELDVKVTGKFSEKDGKKLLTEAKVEKKK